MIAPEGSLAAVRSGVPRTVPLTGRVRGTAAGSRPAEKSVLLPEPAVPVRVPSALMPHLPGRNNVAAGILPG